MTFEAAADADAAAAEAEEAEAAATEDEDAAAAEADEALAAAADDELAAEAEAALADEEKLAAAALDAEDALAAAREADSEDEDDALIGVRGARVVVNSKAAAVVVGARVLVVFVCRGVLGWRVSCRFRSSFDRSLIVGFCPGTRACRYFLSMSPLAACATKRKIGQHWVGEGEPAPLALRTLSWPQATTPSDLVNSCASRRMRGTLCVLPVRPGSLATGTARAFDVRNDRARAVAAAETVVERMTAE